MRDIIPDGTHVRTKGTLTGQDFSQPHNRLPNKHGYIIAYSEIHDCYKVVYFNGIAAWYNPDELIILEPTSKVQLYSCYRWLCPCCQHTNIIDVAYEHIDCEECHRKFIAEVEV